MKYINVLPVIALLLLVGHGDDDSDSCTITADSLNFGEYYYTDSSPLIVSGKIKVSCRRSRHTEVKLDAGQNSGGSFSPRQMDSEGNRLSYNIYTDSKQTEIWGDGTAGTVAQFSKKKKTKFKYYSSIPPGQNLQSGLYADMVIITVNW